MALRAGALPASQEGGGGVRPRCGSCSAAAATAAAAAVAEGSDLDSDPPSSIGKCISGQLTPCAAPCVYAPRCSSCIRSSAGGNGEAQLSAAARIRSLGPQQRNDSSVAPLGRRAEQQSARHCWQDEQYA